MVRLPVGYGRKRQCLPLRKGEAAALVKPACLFPCEGQVFILPSPVKGG
jgi:hypothetical protein